MRKRTAEHNAKIGDALRGRTLSDDHRSKMIAAKTGRCLGPENPNWRGGEWLDHPVEKARVYNATAQANRRGVENALTLEEWLGVLDEYEHRCAYCFGPFEQLDHVAPMAFGGGNTRDNVVPSCSTCNKRKTVRSGGTPAGWIPSIASRFWPRLAEELYA